MPRNSGNRLPTWRAISALDRAFGFGVPGRSQSQGRAPGLVSDADDGFQFFMETYLPHYVAASTACFTSISSPAAPRSWRQQRASGPVHRAARVVQVNHLSLGFALYCIVRGLKRYVLEVCDVYAQAALLIEAIKAELTTNPRLAYDFPDVCGQGRVWREGEMVTRTNIRIEGLGAGRRYAAAVMVPIVPT